MNVFKCYVLKVKDIFSKTPLGLSADTYGYRNSLSLFYIFLFMYYNAYLQWRLILMYFTFRSWYRSWMLNLLTPVVRSSRLAWSLTSDSLFFSVFKHWKTFSYSAVTEFNCDLANQIILPLRVHLDVRERSSWKTKLR